MHRIIILYQCKEESVQSLLTSIWNLKSLLRWGTDYCQDFYRITLDQNHLFCLSHLWKWGRWVLKLRELKLWVCTFVTPWVPIIKTYHSIFEIQRKGTKRTAFLSIYPVSLYLYLGGLASSSCNFSSSFPCVSANSSYSY